MSAAPPRTPHREPEDRVGLAHAAHARAQELAAAGEAEEALRWAERAHRLLPADGTLALALGVLCLGRDDPKAARLLAPLAERYDIREAWVGLAIARRNLGDLGGALTAAQAALSRHVPDDALARVADSLAIEGHRPGWCGVTLAGELRVRLTGGGQRIAFAIDGHPQPALSSGRFRIPRARWQAARRITLMDTSTHLLGSPIDAAAIRRIEGCVAARDGALEGWAWHPADPAAAPVVTIVGAGGRSHRMKPRDVAETDAPSRPLGRPRRIALSKAAVAGMTAPLRVLGDDGADLLGSPLDPLAEQRGAVAAAIGVRAALGGGADTPAAMTAPLAVPADIVGPSPPVGRQRRRRVPDVVIAVHGGGGTTRACLDSVLATVARPSRVVVVDDATDEPDLAAHLTALADRGRIHLIRHATRAGYIASANAGLRACAGRDVVLLNSDTLVPPAWLTRLREVAYSAGDIGTVSPLSNNATLVSYPRRGEENPAPDLADTARLSALARRVHGATAIDIPVTVGFCMYVRGDCLDAVGPLRGDVFAQGYGEENDFCLRARHLGWRHVAAPGVYVAHVGAVSFGAAGEALRWRNQAVLERLHPGHAALIAAHGRADPLAEARRRLDLARWRTAGPARRGAVLLVTHDAGGGVARQVAARCADHAAAGRRPVVLRPAARADGAAAIRLSDGMDDAYPNLSYAMPDELPALVRLLRAMTPSALELHHVLGHHVSVHDLIAALGVAYEVHVHDYVLLCPRVTLVGRDRRYCGEPEVATCEACQADLGSYMADDIPVAGLRQRSAALLAGARRVVVPSADTASRLRRHFPAVRPEVVPHEDDTAPGTAATAASRGRARICVVGAIGVDKGFDMLLACARDAADRALPLEFVVVGHTIDDGRLLQTGRVFVTGEFDRDEAVALIRQQNAELGWIPSVWPETWCFALSDAWRAGLRVAAFDLGAQAERIRASGRGVLLPLGASPAAINSALLAAVGLSAH